jgi:threonine dehydratase
VRRQINVVVELLSCIAMIGLSPKSPLIRTSVQEAHRLIQPHIHLTPVLASTTLSTLASTPQSPLALQGTRYEGCTPARPRMNLFFKCENYQRVGAFKSRGAFHALARLSNEELTRGVVTHSSGAPMAGYIISLVLAAFKSNFIIHRQPRTSPRPCCAD